METRDNDDILGMNKQTRLYGDVTLLMLKGAGYAAVFCLAIWFLLAAMAWVGRLLPEESRDTPDPIIRSDAVVLVLPVIPA